MTKIFFVIWLSSRIIFYPCKIFSSNVQVSGGISLIIFRQKAVAPLVLALDSNWILSAFKILVLWTPEGSRGTFSTRLSNTRRLTVTKKAKEPCRQLTGLRDEANLALHQEPREKGTGSLSFAGYKSGWGRYSLCSHGVEQSGLGPPGAGFYRGSFNAGGGRDVRVGEQIFAFSPFWKICFFFEAKCDLVWWCRNSQKVQTVKAVPEIPTKNNH